jgi:hypothetical protein
VKTRLLVAGAAAVAVLLPSSGSAQSLAPCDPSQTADVQVTTKDRVHGGKDKPLYETHEVALSAAVQADVGNVQLTPQPGVRILEPGSNGRKVDVVIPPPPSLSVTVSWDQPVSSDPADTSRCSATRTISFPVLRAKPPTVKLRGPSGALAVGNATFEVNPARTGESLSPIELTLRTSARAELPSSHARALRWSVPMRPGDRKHYSKKLPALTPFLSQAKACRYWYLSCGAVHSHVDANRFGYLSFRQPSRWAAPSGILVEAREDEGPSPRHFGFDIQARQDGRLIARYQRAGVCRNTPGPFSGVYGESCQTTALKNFPR